jgi:hypothetical protein
VYTIQIRKEVSNMTYSKPEVLALASASNAIQGIGKDGGVIETAYPHQPSTPAYEADE